MKELIDRKRRSESLTKKEHKAFVNLVNSYPTKFDASIHIGISRPTMNLVIIRGSGHPDTIKKIKEKLKEAEGDSESQPEKAKAIA